MLPAPSLTTPRLLLEPLNLAHAPDLFPVFSNAETMRWWHELPHENIYQTEWLIYSALARITEPAWAVVLKESMRAIGMVNYIDALVPGLGYIIGSPYWRQGYGSEAVTAAIEFGFATMQLNRIELWIHSENIASQRLANKVGFRQRGQFYQHFGRFSSPHETLVYGLRADEWGASQQLSSLPAREIAFYGISPRITAPDVSEALAFYRDRLGFAVDYQDGDPPVFAILSRGEWTTERAQIHIMQSDSAGTGSLYIRVGADIDRLYAEFREQGVNIDSPPETRPYGMREFSLKDLNGWQLTFSGTV